MQLYTIEQLSGRISRTPEGYILCRGAVLARTGEQIYGAEEMAEVEGIVSVDGTVRVERTPKEVFRPETIASANGKSLVNDHHDVDPTNWKELTDGIVFNARRGEGLEADLLLADILITDPTAMDAVDAGKVELSCGYDAEYRALGPGRAAQFNIVINHVALVEKGRCGPRCAIRDAAPREVTMSLPKLAFMKPTDLVKVQSAVSRLPPARQNEEYREAWGLSGPGSAIRAFATPADINRASRQGRPTSAGEIDRRFLDKA